MKVRQFRVPAAVAARRLFADRAGLIVAAIFYVMVTSVLSGLWRVGATAAGGAVVGYSAVALTWYVATTEISINAIRIRLIEEIGTDIADGSIAVELLRPLPSVMVRLAVETGQALARGAALVPVGIVLCWVTAGPPPSWRALALVPPALVLAIAANLALQHAVAGVAFWLRDARSVWFLYQKVVFIVGGMLLPLEVLPGWLHDVAIKLPFMAMAYVPGRLAAGFFEPELLLVQAGWVVVLVATAVAMFAAGQRRLQVVGG